MKISHLNSGGLITNYYCTSRCGHCLYRCSPKWKKDYIDKEMALQNLLKIRSLNCYSVHIGGGEPMLNLPKLIDVARAAKETGVSIDYVETNSSWFIDEDKAKQTLQNLLFNGINCLLVSISPFHNEHIAFYKVKGVIKACRETGMQVFPWVMDFYQDIDSFDDRETHGLKKYVDKFGEDYLQRIPSRYWTHFGGRALNTFSEILPQKPLDVILENHPCNELTDTSHFHLDLYGNYIPGLCSGFTIRRDDLGKELEEKKYPIINMLLKDGIKSFLNYAQKNHDFEPKEKYLNKCDLCNDIRFFLVNEIKYETIELQPKGYYQIS